MTAAEVAAAVKAWITETLPELTATYHFIPSAKNAGLPDAVVDVAEQRDGLDFEEFPWRQLQNAPVRKWNVEVSVMVDNSDPEAAADQLHDMADRLSGSLLSGGNLGGRVPFASPFSTFDFTNPFVEWDDGTRGREMTMTMAVGELLEVPQ